MGITKFPAGISSQGVPVIGGSYYTTGTVFFVDSTTGSNGNSGTDKDHPFSTIDYAVGRCTANKGDVIIVMPNHTETVTEAGGLDLDVEGITIVGLGDKSDRPLITLTTATTADIDVDAADITLKNFRIDLTGIDAIACGLDVNTAGFTLDGCDIEVDDTAGQSKMAIDVAGVDDVTIKNCYFHGIGASAHGPVCTQAINVSATGCDRLSIEDNTFMGWFTTSIVSATKTCDAILVQRNTFVNYSDTGALCIDLGSTTTDVTGCIANNSYIVGSTGTLTTILAGGQYGKCGSIENYATALGAGVSGMICPEAIEPSS